MIEQHVRAAYDAVAGRYAEHFKNELDTKPWGRATLAVFAELVHNAGGGLVADLGCGPGAVTADLHSRGLDVYGVDLSPAMVAVARRIHPEVRFTEGSMVDPDNDDNSLSGIVAWYSVIHTQPGELPGLFDEFHRVLAPGGYLLLAFQIGDEPLHLANGFGHPIELDFYRSSPEHMTELLRQSGIPATAQVTRDADETERTPQAHLLARKPATH